MKLRLLTFLGLVFSFNFSYGESFDSDLYYVNPNEMVNKLSVKKENDLVFEKYSNNIKKLDDKLKVDLSKLISDNDKLKVQQKYYYNLSKINFSTTLNILNNSVYAYPWINTVMNHISTFNKVERMAFESKFIFVQSVYIPGNAIY